MVRSMNASTVLCVAVGVVGGVVAIVTGYVLVVSIVGGSDE